MRPDASSRRIYPSAPATTHTLSPDHKADRPGASSGAASVCLTTSRPCQRVLGGPLQSVIGMRTATSVRCKLFSGADALVLSVSVRLPT